MTSASEMVSDVAVITGGASGFGRALAEECALHGMRVALLDRDGERAEQEAAVLAATHAVDAFGLGVDVEKSAEVTDAATAVSQRFGRADLVVSNVGVQLFGAVERLTDDEWQWVLDVNVVGAARTARSFLPLLRAAPRGVLAFTTSASVMAPGSRMGAYQTSKFALWGLAETLRLELADDGIAVSVIFPSGMMSRHLETSADAQPDHLRRAIGDDTDFEAMIASNPDLARDVTTPEEAARNVFEGLRAGDRYVVTHGDLVDPIAQRSGELTRAAERARDVGTPVVDL